MSAKRGSGRRAFEGGGGSEIAQALARASSLSISGVVANKAALIPRGAFVLVGCSGGADSVALSVALCELAKSHPELELRVALGHIDHRLRRESASEAEKVARLAESIGAPFLLEKLDAEALREAIARNGLEAAAREFRYAALERMAIGAKCTSVATAHTRRDQAETVLLRLSRGGGLGALAGIRASRRLGAVQLIRPLLEVSRASTESFCRARGISFVEDPHNRDPKRARARVRAALAQLEALLNPRLEEHLAAAARAAAEEDSLLDGFARSALEAAGGEATLSFQLAPLAALPDALLRRALLIAAADAGARPERDHLERLCIRLRRGSGSIDLPGARASIRAGLLSFQASKDAKADRARRPRQENAPALHASDAPPPLTIHGPGRYAWHQLLLEVAAPGDLESAEGASPADTHHIDAARAPFPWTLRALIPGDRFAPARGRRKKVSDLWIDAKVARETRSALPLLADATGAIFFVSGLRPGAPSIAPLAQPVAFRFLAAPRSSPRKNPALVEQRANEPRANIPVSIDEESR